MSAEVAIVGAGYVGVPLAQVFAEAGVGVVLVDVDADRIATLQRGESYIEDVPSEELAPLVEAGTIAATTDYDALRETDAILVALPTPLSANREPDLSIVLSATGHDRRAAAGRAPRRPRVDLLPGHDPRGSAPAARGAGPRGRQGLPSGVLARAGRSRPHRLDDEDDAEDRRRDHARPAPTAHVALYERALDTVLPVSSPETAELTKLLENIFRSVNIALVNELAQLCDRMRVDVWEVVEAAATKPFGFMSFKPGPGLGGHCLPVDPFYLSWKAREYDFYTEFIELAGKVNENMPYFCLEKITRALNSHERSVKGSTVHVVGVAYKADVGDLRESPALKLIELLRDEGAIVSYHDPHVPELPEHGLISQSLDGAVDAAHCVAIVTAHSGIDYDALAERAPLVVDFRNATGANGTQNGRVWKL